MSQGVKQSLEEGYKKFVIKNKDGCWGFCGCAPKNPGYGQFRTNMKLVRAHRASWELHYGPIPENMYVLHKCDNPICSKPTHLFLGTQSDNFIDALNKGRHPEVGETHHQAKINSEVAREIKKLLLSGKSCKELARKYNVSSNCISTINTGKCWKRALGGV